MECGMSKLDTTWKLFIGYCLILLLMLLSSGNAFGQDIKVRYFNAEWNSANAVDWCHTNKKGLSSCEVVYIDISKEASAQKEYGVVVVPTIIIFKDGEEVKRFQADVSFKMAATRKEVQGEIDDLNMSDY